MEIPKISVIVPIYNVEKYINRCLDSLINQTLEDIEIILVNDGSPDNCGRICEEYSKIDQRIRVIHKENGGLSSARNAGLELARGEFVAFVDSDDYVDLSIYEKLYNAAKKSKSDTCLCGYNRVRKNNTIESYPNPMGGIVCKKENVLSDILVNMMGSEPSYYRDNFLDVAVWMGIYSRDVIFNNNIRFCSEREFIAEDAIFCIDYIPNSRCISIIPESLYYYCENSDSLTTTYREDRFEKNKILYVEEMRKLKEIGLMKEAKLRVYRMYIADIRCCIMQEAANSSKNGLRKTIKNISKICKDKMTQEILSHYPYNKLPIKQRIFSVFMKINCPRILYTLARMHEIKNNA